MMCWQKYIAISTAILESNAAMGDKDIEHLCDAANLILAARPDLHEGPRHKEITNGK